MTNEIDVYDSIKRHAVECYITHNGWNHIDIFITHHFNIKIEYYKSTLRNGDFASQIKSMIEDFQQHIITYTEFELETLYKKLLDSAFLTNVSSVKVIFRGQIDCKFLYIKGRSVGLSNECKKYHELVYIYNYFNLLNGLKKKSNITV